MAEEKKPDRAGPVVIRKGQLSPPSHAAPEPGSAGAPAEPPAPDDRPLWQRVAERATPAGTPGAAAAAGTRAPGGRPGPSRSPGRGPGGRPRGDGPARRDRAREDRPREAAPEGPQLRGEPPPPPPEAPMPDEGTFAELLAGSDATPRKRWQMGEKVAAKIIQVGHDVAFLELGSGVAEGMIDIAEPKDDAGEVQARIGDIVDGVVVKGGERGVVVSKGRAQSKLHRDHQALVDAAQTGLPVDGVVKAVNKGGLEFKVQRADGRDAVLSRRALLEEERADRARKTREQLAEGAVFDGTVTAVQDYGAFIDIGGLEGLVHVSELAWDRGSKPQDLLKSGDGVKVQVLRIDQDAKKGERISLSVRALAPRPKPKAAPEGEQRTVTAPPPPARVGDVVKAIVDKIEPFGLFVRFPGGRGLVPASESGTQRGTDLRRAFKVGDEIECAISARDEQGRLRLSKVEAEAAAERKEAQEDMRKAAPQGRGGKGFGTLGDLLREKLKGS